MTMLQAVITNAYYVPICQLITVGVLLPRLLGRMSLPSDSPIRRTASQRTAEKKGDINSRSCGSG